MVVEAGGPREIEGISHHLRNTAQSPEPRANVIRLCSGLRVANAPPLTTTIRPPKENIVSMAKGEVWSCVFRRYYIGLHDNGRIGEGRDEGKQSPRLNPLSIRATEKRAEGADMRWEGPKKGKHISVGGRVAFHIWTHKTRQPRNHN